MLLSVQNALKSLLLLRLYTISLATTSLSLSSQHIGPTILLKRLLILRVYNDLLLAVDAGDAAVPVLLDLSAA
jgi:hypothetical protein